MFTNVKESLVSLSAHKVVDDDTRAVQEALSFLPFVKVSKSKIDGSLNVTASLDPREAWENGIFENSRYFRMSLSLEGKVTWRAFVLERQDGVWVQHKARACRVKSLGQFAEKVLTYAQGAARGA